MKTNASIQKDMKVLRSRYSHIVEDIGIFGSFVKPKGEVRDIDIVIKLKELVNPPPERDLHELDLSLPVVKININCYKKYPGSSKYGYHFLLLLTNEAKKHFDIINQDEVYYQI